MKVEVQLRTIAMDFWASLEHKLSYKKTLPEQDEKEISEELKNCAEEISRLDQRMQAIHSRILEEEEADNLETETYGFPLSFKIHGNNIRNILKNRVHEQLTLESKKE